MTTDISSTSRALEWLRALFVAPEVAWILAVGGSTLAWPDWWANIGGRLQLSEWPVLAGLIGLALILLKLTFGQVERISRPDSEARRILVEWPDYWRLALRLKVTLLYAVGGSILIVLGVTLALADYGHRLPVIACATGLGSQMIAALTSRYAAWQVREVLDGV